MWPFSGCANCNVRLPSHFHTIAAQRIRARNRTVLDIVNMQKIASLMFRAISMLAKFILLVYMAKVMAPEDVGLYGIIMASVIWLSSFVGLEFQNFCLRELISGRKKFAFIVSNHQIVLLLNYAALFVLCLAAGRVAGYSLVLLIFVLSVLERQGYEASMLAVALERPLLSAFLLFLRSGSWPILAIGVMVLSDAARNVQFVLGFWVFANALAVVVAYATLYRGRRITLLRYFDKRWVLVGLKTGLIYWLGSLILRMTGVLDRYIMEAEFGLDMVGVYSFYMSIGLSLTAFVDSAVISFMYPDSVKSVAARDYDALARNQRKMLFSTLLLGAALSLGILVAVPLVLEHLESDIYVQHESLLAVSLIAWMAFSLAMTPHFGLYSLNRDGIVLGVNALAFTIFLLAYVAFRYAGGELYSVIYAVVVSYVCLFCMKIVCYHGALNSAKGLGNFGSRQP